MVFLAIKGHKNYVLDKNVFLFFYIFENRTDFKLVFIPILSVDFGPFGELDHIYIKKSKALGIAFFEENEHIICIPRQKSPNTGCFSLGIIWSNLLSRISSCLAASSYPLEK